MADDKDTGVGSQDDQQSEEEESEEEGESQDDNSDDDDSKAGDSQADGESDDADQDDEDDEDDEEEPKTRKDNSFWVGYRKGKKQQKSDKKADQSDDSDDSGDDADAYDEGEDEELDPKDRELLQKELEKVLDPITKELANKKDEEELQGYVSQNPEAKPFEKKIRRFMAHPSRQHLPVETVALEVIGKDRLMKMGAEQGKKADKRASKTKGGGNSVRNADKKGNVWQESQEEFEARQQSLRSKL